MSAGKDSLELKKQDGNWTIPGEDKTPIDNAKVDAMLARLQDTKIQKYLPQKTGKLGLEKPQLVLVIREKNDKPDTEKVLLTVGKAQGKLVPVRRNGLDFPVLIKAEDLDRFNVSKNTLLKAPPKELDEKEPSKKAIDDKQAEEPKAEKKAQKKS